MRYGRAIALAGLVAGLVVLTPAFVLSEVAQTVAQTREQRKAEGDNLLKQGYYQAQEGQVTSALQSWQQALIIYREIQDRRGEEAVLGNLGDAYSSLGNYAKAIEYSEQSLAIAREIKNRRGERLSLRTLGNAYLLLGSYPKAIELHQQSLAIARELKDRRGEAYALGDLGNVYQSMGNAAKLIEVTQQSLAIAREIEDRQTEGEVLGSLGNAYRLLGNYAKMLEYYEQSLAVKRAIRNRPGESGALSDLGHAHLLLGNYAKAIEYYEQALVIRRELKNRRAESTALRDLGTAYTYVANYAKAIEYYEQRLVIAREIKDRQKESQSLFNLGITYNYLGNSAKAIEYLEKASDLSREIKDRRSESVAYSGLGNTYRSLGNSAKAFEYLEKTLAVMREIKDRPGEIRTLSNLGRTYSSVGNSVKAIEFYQQSLAIAREIKNRQEEYTTLNTLGNAYSSLGNYAKAIEFYQQSLAIAREIKSPLSEGESLDSLGFAFFKSGDLPAAAKTLMAGITTWEMLRQTGAGNDANKVSIFEAQAKTYRTLQEVLIAQNLPNAALEIAERGRGRAFVELLAQRLATNRSTTPASPQSVPAPPNLQQIQQIAKVQGATLVQYSIIYGAFKLQGKEEGREAELYIWVISPTGAITFRKADLKPLWQQQNTSLSNLVDQSRETIGARGRSDIDIALSPERLKQQQEQQTQKLKQLHQILIEPIADLLPKDPNQRVIFMPQGELFLVPFSALLDANSKPLIDKHTILIAPAIQVLELTRQQRDRLSSRNSTNNKSLIVGNPIMPKVVTRLGNNPVQLSNLPGAKQEALEIAKLFNTQAMIGAEATKSAIVQQMPSARFIHLATHGLLDDTRGLGVPGAIALTPSGNGQLNDGLLTSDEILDMKLNAELVVLSACDTGRGRITGDGVIGLSRSLITAGVPSIVVSLWKVPDDATALLMTEFYKNLKKSPDKAQALRQAMLTTKQQYPDPLNWAAFTLIGEAE